MRLWVSGADAMPPVLVERFCARGCAFTSPLGSPLTTAAFAEIYGMVELSGPAILRFTPPRLREGRRRRTRLFGARARVENRFAVLAGMLRARLPAAAASDDDGRAITVPIPPYRIKVVDEDGKSVKPGAVGDLVVKGPGVLKSYLGEDAAAKKVTKDGWLFTGDLARRGRLGQIRFVARKKDVIKHGGYSVFPAEIEAALSRHPDVRTAVVLGAPHPTKGQVPIAVVVPAHEDVDRDALLAWSRDRFASYKAPRAVLFLDEADIPRNDNKKVKKDALLGQVIARARADFPRAVSS
jgi:acyl-CoA synthetase (AMP-forming)/AMP-acid ligase II